MAVWQPHVENLRLGAVGGFLFADKNNSAAIDTRPSCLIGGDDAVRRSSITPIEIRDGRLVYGSEIPCEIWDREREVLRKNGEKLRIYRKEFRVLEELKGPIRRDWTLVIAHLPPTQRRVATAKLQSRMVNRQRAECVEDIPLLAAHGTVADLPDQDLIRLLGELNENVFETGRYWVASLPYGVQRQGFFTQYGIGAGDARLRERWSSSALRAGSATYAYGAYKGSFDSIWQALWDDPEFKAAYNMQRVRSPRTEAGRVVYRKINLSGRVIAEIAPELDLATRQALAGWGLEAERHVGEPVAERIRLLCHRAFEALHKREQRYGVGESPCDFDNWPSDDRIGEVEDRLIDAIDRARDKSGP